MQPKFRCWHIEGKQMTPMTSVGNKTVQFEQIEYYTNPEPGFDVSMELTDHGLREEVIVMPWTGFTDSQDVDIYQGDIVEYKDVLRIFGDDPEPRPVFGHDWRAEVIWENGAFTFRDVRTTFWNEYYNRAEIPDWDFAKLLTVVTNIFEEE